MGAVNIGIFRFLLHCTKNHLNNYMYSSLEIALKKYIKYCETEILIEQNINELKQKFD